MEVLKKDRTPNKDLSSMDFHLTKEGSLGLLAYGDLALLAWRKIRPKKTNNLPQ